MLSLVIPLFNEEESLSELHGELSRVCAELPDAYELLFVNDGSNDGSAALLDAMAERDDAVGVIHQRRNFGKAAALDAGFRRARGDVVVTMDADLQDDPAEIPKLQAAIDGGLDVVSGWKKKRHDPLTKTLPSKLFNFCVRLLTGIQLHDFNCGLKAYRREAVEGINLYGELHRYIPVLLAARGFTVGEIEVQHHARKHGESKYGGGRLLKGFLDLLTVILHTRFAARPLHFFGLGGFLLSALGFGVLTYLTVLWFQGEGIGHRPLLFLGMLLMLVGIQLGSLGLVGELLTKTQSSADHYSVASFRAPRR